MLAVLPVRACGEVLVVVGGAVAAIQIRPQLHPRVKTQTRLQRNSRKPSTQKYRLQWQDRKGFARLAILAQCPVVPVVGIGGDEIFTVYESPLTEMVYQRFKLPLPLFRGRGPTVVPRPAALTHYVESGLRPPLVRTDDPALPRAIDEYHAAVTARMNQLMQTVLAR